jgi:hypothetical protein
VYNWPQHTHMAMAGGRCVGVAVSKLEKHRDYFRGYVAMLAVEDSLRGKVCLAPLATLWHGTRCLYFLVYGSGFRHTWRVFMVKVQDSGFRS